MRAVAAASLFVFTMWTLAPTTGVMSQICFRNRGRPADGVCDHLPGLLDGGVLNRLTVTGAGVSLITSCMVVSPRSPE